MAVREPKSQQTTIVQIVGRDGSRKGRLELTSGNIDFFRSNGQEPALRLTYQQLAALLEREIDYREIDAAGSMPKGLGKAQDLVFEALERDGAGDMQSVASGTFSLSNLDPRRVDLGVYHLDAGLADGRRSEKRWWSIQISVPFALSIVTLYIDKWLMGRKETKGRDKNIVITKPDLRKALLRLIKRLED